MDQSSDLSDLYEGQPYPSLSFANSWLDDPAADISKVDAGLYTDLKPAAYWEVTANATASVTLGDGNSLTVADKPSFSISPGVTSGQMSITTEQLETIRRSRAGLSKSADSGTSELPSIMQQYKWRAQ